MPAETSDFVSQATYGRHRGVSRKTVTDWKQKGWLVLNERGQVDVAKTDAALDERPATYRGGVTSAPKPAAKGNKRRRKVDAAPVTVDPPRASVDAGTDDTDADDALPVDLSDEGIAASFWSLAEATRVKEIYLALKRRQDFLVSQGALVSIEEVAVQVEAEYTIVRERLLGIAGKISASLVGLDRAAIEARIVEEVSEALSELHDPGVFAAGVGGAAGAPRIGEDGSSATA